MSVAADPAMLPLVDAPVDGAFRSGRWMLLCIGTLAVVGLVTAVSSAPPGEGWVSLGQHAAHLALGVLAFLAAYSARPDEARRWAPLAVAGLFALLVVMLVTPLGIESHAARRWIRLGPLSLQPSLFLQFLWPIIAASWAARDPLRLRSLRELCKLGGVFLFVMLPVFLQPDYGSVVILGFVTSIVFLFAGAPRKYLWILLPTFIATIWLASLVFPHINSRLQGVIEEGYQVSKGKEAMAHGGLFGQGPGQGVFKYGHVPEGETDFILPLIAEEWGLLGTSVVWLLFVGVMLFGLRSARRSHTRYGVILMAAATAMISFQAAYNIAMVTGAVPVKGLPLPFVSRGGSSVLALSALLGVALRAAQADRRARIPVTELVP